MKLTYAEKLKDPRWQKKRMNIFLRDNWTCVKCYSTVRTLHIHHKKYISGAEPWEYEDHFLVTLCHVCHKGEHEVIIDPDRKYEHLIIYQEEPHVFNVTNVQIAELQNKLKENPTDELMNDILKNIMFLQQQLKVMKENMR